MKKFICLITVIALISPIIAIPNRAFADTNYMRVITEDTPFYKNATDALPLFILPYTYYVNVLGSDENFHHVEIIGDGIAALDGYVPKGALFDDGLNVSSPYVFITLTTADTAVLYQDQNLTHSIQYIFPERQMQYYGSYKSGQETLYFVCYNNRLGYVKESTVYPFSVNTHPNELTFIEKNEPPVPEEIPLETEEPEDYFSIKVIILVCLIFAGLLALFVALKQKPKKSVAISYYDENDYE